MKKKDPPHPKQLRPDVTYPSPDPTKEPVSHNYKKGDQIVVKPDVCVDGYALGGLPGVIIDTESYLIVEMIGVNLKTRASEMRKFKLLRYEVAPARTDTQYQETLDYWSGKKK